MSAMMDSQIFLTCTIVQLSLERIITPSQFVEISHMKENQQLHKTVLTLAE